MAENKTTFYSNDKSTNDEELLKQIKNGNEQALETLIHNYKEIVNMKIGKYFIVGAEKEDIFQEGMIGLFLILF